MSNYLYNLVARSFGLVETAQPRVNSIFEPPRAFSPVDALQNPAPATEEPAAAFDQDERAAPVSPAGVQAAVPSLTIQTAAPDALPSNDTPAALPKTEHPSAPQANVRRQSLSSAESAQAKEREPSPATSASEPQHSGYTPLQPSLQRETRDLSQQSATTPPASTRRDAPVAGSVAQTSEQTARPPERLRLEPTTQVEEKPARVSQGKQAQADAKSRSDESTHERALPEQRVLPEQRLPVRAQVAEQRIVERALERALSTERPSPPLLNNESFANQDFHDLSQRMKAAASDRPQQQAVVQSRSPSETEAIIQQRPETLIVQPQVSRYIETQEQGSLQQTRAAEPEQIVQVTIGRIEVRAASPAPAPARAQHKGSHQPSQSLEEYLRLRAQGGANR